MRALLWISGVLAFLACLAMLGMPAPVSMERSGGPSARKSEKPTRRTDAAREAQADHECPLPARSPAVRGAVPLSGQALVPKSISCLGLASGSPDGENCTARPRTRSNGDPAPVETLLSKRVRLQI